MTTQQVSPPIDPDKEEWRPVAGYGRADLGFYVGLLASRIRSPTIYENKQSRKAYKRKIRKVLAGLGMPAGPATDRLVREVFVYIMRTQPGLLFLYPHHVSGRIKALQKREQNRRRPGFYQTSEWNDLREKVLTRYGRRCMKCNSTRDIEVDHILPRRGYPFLALVFENCQVLCHECNQHKGAGLPVDYRPIEYRTTLDDLRAMHSALKAASLGRRHDPSLGAQTGRR
jgi:5-methylcytosine-specific restriction endonuclease McrA